MIVKYFTHWFTLAAVATALTFAQLPLWAVGPGSMDLSFRPVFDLSASSSYTFVAKVVPIGDQGKVVVGGQFDTVNGQSTNNSLVMLNRDGSLDTNFDTGNGIFITNGVIAGYVAAISVQPDGKLLASGVFDTCDGSPANALVRLNPDGSRDTNFNIGSGPRPNEFYPDSFVNGVAVLNNGQLLVSGDFDGWDGQTNQTLVRLQPNGAVDPTYQVVVTPILDEPMTTDVARSPDGNRILVMAYNIATLNGTDTKQMLALDQYGNIDTNFNTGTGPNDVVQRITFLADGKILICGDFTEFDGVPCNRVARLHPNGSLDTNFVAPIFFGPASVYAPAASVQYATPTADGKVVVSGIFSLVGGVPRNSLARLNANGSLDLSFDPGTGAKNLDGQPAFVVGLTSEENGMIMGFGDVVTYNEEAQVGLFRFYTASQLVINGLARETNGGVTIDFTKPTAAPAVLEGTQDFVTWTALATNTQPAGLASQEDPNAVNLPRRYYRLKSD